MKKEIKGGIFDSWYQCVVLAGKKNAAGRHIRHNCGNEINHIAGNRYNEVIMDFQKKVRYYKLADYDKYREERSEASLLPSSITQA